MTLARSLSLAALAAATLAALGGCTALGLGTGDVSPVFVAESQPRGDTLEIASVTLVRPGYVVVHDDEGGQPGTVLGHSELLDAGTHEDVSIPLDSAGTGGGVWPMLHVDDGNGTYEFPGADAPAMIDGTPVMTSLAWR